MAEGPVEGVVNVELAPLAVAVKAEVCDVESRSVADDSTLVVVEDEVEERGVAARAEVLSEPVYEEDILAASVEAVELRDLVALAHGEEGDVVLIPVRVEVAEQTRAELIVGEEEAAEVGVEVLHADAKRYEVEVRADDPESLL